jgi:hypothetical protein
MPKKPLDPRDFVVVDPFGRTLHFYIVKGEYWRMVEDVALADVSGPNPRQVGKTIYALLWLETCLADTV